MSEVLRRNTFDKIIGGVAGGIADYLAVPKWLIRGAFVALYFAHGLGILIYVILWMALPSNSNYYDMEENKSKRRREESNGNILAGVILAGIGGMVLITRYFPEIDFNDIWPWALVAAGLFMIIKGIGNK